MQLLRRVHEMVASVQSPDFQKIKTAALASKPPCSGSLPGIYQFALRSSLAGHCRHSMSHSFANF